MNSATISFRGFDGLQLAGTVCGDSNAWPVLFLHGGGQTRHAWDKTLEAVAAQGWQSVALDLRGHGDSGWASNYSLAAFGADCVAVVDQLKRPPVLVGASLGGMAAVLAEGSTDRVVSIGLVLVDITAKIQHEGVRRIRDFMQSGSDGFQSLQMAADAIAAYTPQRPKRMNPSGLMKVLRQRDGRWFWHWDPEVVAQASKEVTPEGLEPLLDAAMSNIDVQTLLVRGLLSDVVGQDGVDHLLARIPGSTAADVHGATHMIAGDRNDRFADVIIEFLETRIRPTLHGIE